MRDVIHRQLSASMVNFAREAVVSELLDMFDPIEDSFSRLRDSVDELIERPGVGVDFGLADEGREG